MAEHHRVPLQLGTDCSGIGSICVALAVLGIPFVHVFGSEVENDARRQLESTFPPQHFYRDLRNRCIQSMPRVHLYVAGFPCQAFSAAGNMEGFAHQSGDLFFYIYEYIRLRRPLTFILENVVGLATVQDGHCFRVVLRCLWDLGNYNIYWQLLNTNEHGIPQNRPRYYFIGILRSHDVGSFVFPARTRPPSLEVFLDARSGRPSWADLPPSSQGSARANVRHMLQQVDDMQRDPFGEPWVFDIDSSIGRGRPSYDMVPCITRSRWQGHWVSNRGRRLSLTEMMRLQGFPSTLPIVIDERDFRRCLGNCMSVNILLEIIKALDLVVSHWEPQP